MQEKIIPQNISAEQNVLCAMLIDNKAVGTVSGILKPDDFYRQAHQVIYRAMLNLYGRSEPVDLVTVIEELRKMNKLQEVGDVSYITLLGEVAPTAANVKFHAQIVADKAMQRQLIESGTVISNSPDADGAGISCQSRKSWRAPWTAWAAWWKATSR